jgi:hypothetical protein
LSTTRWVLVDVEGFWLILMAMLTT